MSATMRSAARDVDRLLGFEVADHVYALPITAVLEVAEASRATAVPGLRQDAVAAMNWHGEALPLLASALLLEELRLEEVSEEEESSAAEAEPAVAAAENADDPWAAAGLCRPEEQAAAPPAQPPCESFEREHVLVVSGRSDEAPSMGMPVDRVIGLVEDPLGLDPEDGTVEKRPADGRAVHILDPQRLVACAEGLIERAAV